MAVAARDVPRVVWLNCGWRGTVWLCYDSQTLHAILMRVCCVWGASHFTNLMLIPETHFHVHQMHLRSITHVVVGLRWLGFEKSWSVAGGIGNRIWHKRDASYSFNDPLNYILCKSLLHLRESTALLFTHMPEIKIAPLDMTTSKDYRCWMCNSVLEVASWLVQGGWNVGNMDFFSWLQRW